MEEEEISDEMLQGINEGYFLQKNDPESLKEIVGELLKKEKSFFSKGLIRDDSFKWRTDIKCSDRVEGIKIGIDMAKKEEDVDLFAEVSKLIDEFPDEPDEFPFEEELSIYSPRTTFRNNITGDGGSGPIKKWITLEDAMLLLRVSRKTEIQKLVDQNLINRSQAKKGHDLYDRDSIIDYLKKNPPKT